MVCPNCGKEITTDVCYNCGYNVREHRPQEDVNKEMNYTYNNNYNNYENNENIAFVPEDEGGFLSEGRIAHTNGMAAEMKAKNWFAYFALSTLFIVIPIIGPLIDLIFKIVLLARRKTALSLKGLIKFQLICMLVVLGIGIISLLITLFFLPWEMISNTLNNLYSLI